MADNNRPRTPTEEEIAAVLADARASDPSGYSYSDYYYFGTSGEPEPQIQTSASGPSNLVDIPQIDILNATEDFEGGDVVVYHHAEDNTWRAYPPAQGAHITELPEIEKVAGESPEVTVKRKRDRLRARGIRIIKRVKRWRVAPEGAPPKEGRVTRIMRELAVHFVREVLVEMV